MRAAVYSGSFNPLHIGHLAIIRYLVNEAGFERVHLVVSPKNPLKDGISSSTGQERHKAALEAVARHAGEFGGTDPEYGSRKVIADGIELAMPEPHYTIRTLDALKAAHPDDTFTLVMGADNLADIRRWRDYKRILTEYGVMAYPRKGFDLHDIRRSLMEEIPGSRIDLMDAANVDISSTEIREALAQGKDMSGYLM